ncbi:MAG TPA: hypothetical protein VFG42_23870 [Baekduia sp.]|uniref:hypothetical protein n=1 Tax=Baekduia sp. TaxID=2600305 RepID=UPI002D76D1D7|nr:hypothetical protein [Baekduia sp.]HET6509853.1 hypothetical protein [Baekduia sp.]
MIGKGSAALVVATALAVPACGGQSSADKAKSQVCDARTSISEEIDTLKSLPVSTASIPAAEASVKAIANDLKSITDAQGNLSGQRKQQVEQANHAFTAQVEDITSKLTSSGSLSEAKTQLDTALHQLTSSYEKTFAKVDCGGS